MVLTQAFFLGFLLSFTYSEAQDCTSAKKPTRAPPQAYGDSFAGCLDGALTLPLQGGGYFKLETRLQRSFAHPALVGFIKNLGSESVRKRWGMVSIGDLSGPRGGALKDSSHRSHQNGLDADIPYQPLDPANKAKNYEPPSVLNSGKNGLDDKYWGKTQVEMIQYVVSLNEVDRIFVNPLVKKYFCTHSPKADWLKKVRPWWGHDHHFHVRVRCPERNAQCKDTQTVESADCGKNLEWWFTKEAWEQYLKRKKEPLPLLPEICKEICRKP